MMRMRVVIKDALLAVLVSTLVLGVSEMLSASQAQKAQASQANSSTTASKKQAVVSKTARSSAKKSSTVGSPTHYAPNPLSPRAQLHYDLLWGVGSFTVKSVESGEMIRFTYRVVDPEKAKVLNDKTNEPSLIDAKAGVKLVVPEMDKVGKLRQSSTPIAGKVYWMAFSNKGGYVKPGHRVDVVIGQFRAGGLVVQ